ncbi:unnamed protein product [Medioppia subpectinata]|uniref:SGNH hydrolase-type esterase domain-containing protein n=1 Tax=Medioppia subpectinata TaxID=1979941 RepID=A0A7R9KL50_9ACAR|nr:unnamed protein product [Medioppia subpectinata]CAG2104385.1 unnamed protein product [Medioppia subpectinata]
MYFEIVLCIGLIGTGLSVPWEAAAKGGNWPETHQRLINQTVQHRTDIQLIFLGDSITARWANVGRDVWAQHYASRHAYNYGIEGDRTENVLYRIEDKEFDSINPKVLVMKIGTNNLGDCTAPEISIGIYEIIRHLRAKLPNTKLLLLGVLPRDGNFGLKVEEINKIIAKFDDKKHVFFLDMSKHFSTAPGKEIPDLYDHDKVHLVLKGYQVWQQAMEPLLKSLLGEK